MEASLSEGDVAGQGDGVLLLPLSLPVKRFEATIKLTKSVRRPVDPVVDEDHAGHGAPEGHDGGEHGVGDVRLEHADGRLRHHARLARPGDGKAVLRYYSLEEVRNI